jgi:hypothetical protein
MGRTLIPNAKLGDRYRVSGETIRRWKADPRLQFPKPAAVINDREYFDDDELQAWEAGTCSDGACLNPDPTEVVRRRRPSS